MDNRITLPNPITHRGPDKAFPIFRLEAHYSCDGTGHDYAGSNKMYLEMPSAEQSMNDINEWWKNFTSQDRPGENKTPIAKRNPILQHLRFRLIEYETWCLNWFSHYTFIDGKGDEELIKSFHRFIARKVSLGEDRYCLMGAEDLWRHSKPCHCEHCQKRGVTHISH